MNRERILVATDLSEHSYAVIDKAMSFALRYDKWLEVLHVVEPSLFAFGFAKKSEDPAALDAQTQERLLAISAKIRKKLGRTIDKLNVETRLGNVAATVEAYAREKRVSMVIAGDSEHKSGIKASILGSTAKRIINKSEVPVLIAKTSGDADYKTVYVPTDFSNRSLESLAYMAALFPAATFILDHVIDAPSEAQFEAYEFDSGFMDNFTDSARKHAESRMNAFIAKLRARGESAATVSLKPQFAVGHIDSEWVVSEAGKAGADLIGLTADTTLFSNTFPIMEKAHCDVLLFKE